MAGAEAGREQTYQWQLRALGAYLDATPCCRISVTEVPDGFILRLQRALHKLEPRVEYLKREALVEQLQQLFTHPKSGKRPYHQGIWAAFPNGHQDFFRALGYELDEVSARGILVDELEDGIAVTYTYPEPEKPERWKKRMIKLGMSDIETILNTAFERRRKPAPTVDPFAR
ncbi:MAG TPA: hypothetical protein VKX16_10595 [Chloroflexota bacterium]|nr:hypothetical protein [Chloroflexota bacterium]